VTKKAIRTTAAPTPAGSYSQAVSANGFLYTAGLGPQNPDTGEVEVDSVGDQTRQVMRNLSAILQEADASFRDVVKVTVHLADLHRDFKEFNAAYSEFVEEPFPVRTTVGSTLANILVEIDVVAALGQDG
jgi:2-iminobutanoate/2-iminopropanoate deaminase